MKNLIKLFVIIFSLGFLNFTFAAGTVDHFDVKASKTKINMKEKIDITIRALDKDGNLVKDYVGDILIYSETDPKAEFPGTEESTYKFKASDEGDVKFENAVQFTKAGVQDISIYDMENENIFGFVEIEVLSDSGPAQSGEISIKYPENGITLPLNKIKVNGATQKNHSVKIILNNEKEFESISNGQGIYEVEISNIPSGKNTLKAKLLDADGKVIGESSEVLFNIEANAPKFKSIKLSPEAKEYDGEKSVDVEVLATNGLENLDIVMNDVVFKLKEDKSGVYKGKITTPKDSGEYEINVNMKNELGIETKEKGVKKLKVKVILAAGGEEDPVELNCDDFKKELEVKNIKTIKLKSKSLISWDKVEKANSYNVYKKDRNGEGMTLIENVNDNKYEIVIQGDVIEYDDFAVKAVFKDDVCDVESENFSDITKVQTGPKEILFVIGIISLFISSILLFKRKKV